RRPPRRARPTRPWTGSPCGTASRRASAPRRATSSAPTGGSRPGGTRSPTTCPTAPPRRTGCSGTSRSCSSSRPRRGPSAPAPRPSPSCRTRRPRRTSASHRRRMGRTTAHPSPTRRHRPRSSPWRRRRRRRRRPGSISSSPPFLSPPPCTRWRDVPSITILQMIWAMWMKAQWDTPSHSMAATWRSSPTSCRRRPVWRTSLYAHAALSTGSSLLSVCSCHRTTQRCISCSSRSPQR
ncbi:hypothetical protein ACJX0J_023104, partial [Zea mays]